MMEAVFQWIKNITYYLIFVSLLSHLMPAGKYEQYMKLFFGAVFILLVVAPLTGGLHLDGRLAQAYEQIRFTQEQGEFEQKLWGMEEERIARMIKQYEEAVGMDVRAMAEDEGFYCLSAGARIEEREGEEKFGQVVEIVMVIGGGEGEEDRSGMQEERGRMQAERSEMQEERGGMQEGEKVNGVQEGKDGIQEGKGGMQEGEKVSGKHDDRDADGAGEENKVGKMVSIDPVQIVIDRGNKDGVQGENVEKTGERGQDKDGGKEDEGIQGKNLEKNGEKIQNRDGEKDNEGAQNGAWEKTQEAVEEFQRKVARYYGLEEEAVRITWKDN